MAESSSQPNKSLRLLIVASIVCLVVLVLFIKFVDLKAMHDKVAALNGWMIFLLMVVLPLFGVPVSFLFVVGGAKFGHTWGLALAAVAIACHLAGSYWIGNSILRKPLDWFFRRSGYNKPRIPESDAFAICALIALFPGLPYAVKNYMMVLGDVKFRPFFFACLPMHFLSVIPGVLFGDFSGSMTRGKLIFLGVYFVLFIGLTRYVYQRLRQRRNVDVLATKPEPDPV